MKRKIRCLFYGKQDDDSAEHIVPNALGGRLTIRGVIGLKANNELGKIIDAPFEEALRPLSIHLGAKRGDGKPVAPLRGIITEAGERIDVHSGGFPEMNRKGTVKIVDVGSDKQFSVTACSEEKAIELVAHQLKRFGRDASKIKMLRAELTGHPAGKVQHRVSLGGAVHGRAVMKMALMSLARASGRKALDLPDFANAIHFVVSGQEDIPRFTVAPERLAEIRKAVGGRVGVHTLAIFDVDGGCCAVFLAFGAFPFWVKISECQIGLRQAIVHHVDPVANTHAVVNSDIALHAPEYLLSDEGFLRLQDALAELLEHAARRQHELWLEDSVNRAVKPLRAIPVGTTLTPEHFNLVGAIIAEAIAHRMFGLDTRRPVPEEPLREQIAQKLADLPKGNRK